MTVIEVKRAPGRRMGWCAHLVSYADRYDEDFGMRVVEVWRSRVRVSGATAEDAAHAAIDMWPGHPVLFCTRRRP